jgi:hypothetical protein
MLGAGAGIDGGSLSASGTQDRQAPAPAFQQRPHAYWRHCIQKLNVRRKASVIRVEDSWLSS